MSTPESEILGSLPPGNWLQDAGLLDGERLRPLVIDWLGLHAKPNTRKEYLRDLGRAYAWFASQQIVLLDADRPQLARWAEHMREGTDPGSRGPAAETTVARRLAALSSFFSFVVELREGLTDPHRRERLPAHNPAANLRRPDLSMHRYGRHGAWLDTRATGSLLRAARADTPRAFALVSVMLSTAARTSEILAANVVDLAYLDHTRVLSVPRDAALAYLPIDQTASDAIEEYLGPRQTGPLLRTEPGRGNVGGRRLDEPYTLRLLRRLATEAGLPAEVSRQMHPHLLRHTALARAAEQGATDEQIQALAGYGDIRSTRRYTSDAEAQEGWRTQ